jgi:frataxin-like iron-binding protein CyaY
MSEEQEFKKHADATLSLLSRDLAGAADDYGFHSSFSRGVIAVECGSAKITITPNPQAQQIWVSIGPKQYKLDWDIVEAAFVHSESCQSLRELVEQALSKQLRQEVSL